LIRADFATHHLQLQRRQADKIFNAFFTTNLMAWAWDFASAVPSLSHMAAACGPPTTDKPPRGASFYFTLPSKSEPPE
jgi:hypothetical protein